jgi:hypothetical protein
MEDKEYEKSLDFWIKSQEMYIASLERDYKYLEEGIQHDINSLKLKQEAIQFEKARLINVKNK